MSRFNTTRSYKLPSRLQPSTFPKPIKLTSWSDKTPEMSLPRRRKASYAYSFVLWNFFLSHRKTKSHVYVCQ